MSRDFQQDLSDTAKAVQNATSIEGHLADDEFEQASVLSESEGTDIVHSETGDWQENDDLEFSSDIGDFAEADTQKKLRQDLRIAKEAGFRVGCLGSLDGIFVVSLACRISRLGINEDVMQAWSIKPSEYIVLLIYYPSSYRNFAEILQMGDKQRCAIQLHAGLCDSYKPDFEHAFRIFKDVPAQRNQVQDYVTPGATGNHLRPLFIEGTLNGLLNERFLAIVNSRWRIGLSWKGAELFTHRNQGKSADFVADLNEEYFEPDVYGDAGPEFLVVDHMAECNGDASQMSLPLVAMQFTLRHFVYCTKFCLVCHCRLEVGFESLKPFVCSNALCLYQFMSLGMGTALEYEIRSEPYVVDLLVSLTYSRAVNYRLEDFPSGLRLMVPGAFPGGSPVGVLPEQILNYPRAIFKPASLVLQFHMAHSFKAGGWVVLKEQVEDGGLETRCWHCRVQTHDAAGTLQLSHPTNADPLFIQGESRPRDQSSIEVKVIPYNRNFDDLRLDEKQHMVSQILDTLPSVEEMTAFLGDKSTKRELSAWKERISPAALDILRWIVASNRSFIKLDDPRNSQNKVIGMDDFIQFRLVQGAPDKEHDFTRAVFRHGRRACHSYPTMFAWHGSPLYNWHSILREGLHFEHTAHGRAYGNGVYFSSSFQQAIAYTARIFRTQLWRNSKLNVKSAISLNEIVNDTKHFVHSRECLVVDQLDWIQPRFLFVRSKSSPFDNPDNPPVETPGPVTLYQQDPSRLADGPTGTRIEIPASAFGIRRWEGYGNTLGRPAINLSRKRKRDAVPAITDSIDDDGEEASIATDSEDLEILLSDS